MNSRTVAITELAKEKAKLRQREVLAMIEEMENSGESITFYSVAKRSGAAKSYLYNNKIISEKIRNCRKIRKENRTEESKDVIIKAQRKRIASLEKELAEAPAIREKCEKLMEENRKLKLQLETAYKF